MNKIYTWNINSFKALENALNDWFSIFKDCVDITNENLSSLDSLSKFNYSVEWEFLCYNNNLASLKWCPQSVGWGFFCGNNKLITLVWAPKHIGWDFSCQNNNLMSIEWCPQYVWKAFDCSNNQLTTLEWCPDIVKEKFLCENNKFIPLEQKKWNIFRLWDHIYIGNPNRADVQNLIKCNITKDIDSKAYYESFNNFVKSTVELDKKDITDTDIILNWKKFKRNILNL
jgi:hypothetical protein